MGIDFTLGSSEEAQQAQKTSGKRKQIGSEANPRSTPAPRKKNRTAWSPSEEVRRVGETEQIRSGGTERKPAGGGPELAAHHHRTLAGVSRECTNGERAGKKRGGDGGRLYRPCISRQRMAGGSFRCPTRARQSHPPPAGITPKSPTQRRAEPSPRATKENGVQVEPGGGGGSVSRRPGRGRG